MNNTGYTDLDYAADMNDTSLKSKVIDIEYIADDLIQKARELKSHSYLKAKTEHIELIKHKIDSAISSYINAKENLRTIVTELKSAETVKQSEV